jgi:hypothetical protein
MIIEPKKSFNPVQQWISFIFTLNRKNDARGEQWLNGIRKNSTPFS